MPDSYTPNLNLTQPEVGASTDTWGNKINTNLTTIDGLFDTGPVLKITKGGTGAASAAAARTNLDVPGISTTNTFTQGQIISVTDNTNAALRVTQLGTGEALRIEDSTNPDSTPFIVSASGNVGVGLSPTTKLQVYDASSSVLRVEGDATTLMQMYRYATDANASSIQLYKGRGTKASPSIISTGDALGSIFGAGHNGSGDFNTITRIDSYADTVTSGTSMSSSIRFGTANAAATATERLRIGPAGQIGIGGANYGTAGQVIVSGGSSAAVSWGGATSYVVSAANANTGTSYEKKDIDPFAKLEILLASLSHDSGSNRTFQIQVSVDNGVNYSTALTISDGVGSGAAISGSVAIHNANASGAATRLINIVTGPQASAGNAFISTSSTASLSGPINAIKIILSGTGNLDGSGAVTIVGYR